jgi:hypothetical protein
MGYQVVRETEWILAKLWELQVKGFRQRSSDQDKRTNERIVLISPFFLPSGFVFVFSLEENEGGWNFALVF